MQNIIQLADYPKEQYRAYWEIKLTRFRNSEGLVRFDWAAQILSREPTGFVWEGEATATWPEGVPVPVYPEPPTAQAKALEAAGNRPGSRALMDEWRKRCSEIFENSPKPLCLLEEGSGAIGEWKPEGEAEQAARLASQQWVLDRIENYRREEVV